MIEQIEEIRQAEKDAATLLLTSGPSEGPHDPSADWFRQSQIEGWETFQGIPLPSRTDERWRFASVKSFDPGAYVAPLPVPESMRSSLISRSRGLQHVSGRMIFANDLLLRRDLQTSGLAERGVIWLPLEQASNEPVFREHFLAQKAVLGSAKFAALHQAYIRSGTFLYVPPNVEVELPLEVFHWLEGEGGSTFPHTLVVAGRHSKVTLIDHLQSSRREASGMACGVTDLIVGEGASVTYVCVQDWSDKTVAVQINSTVVERDAHATTLHLHLGSAYARTENVSRLAGEGGRSDMLAVSAAAGDQQFDQRTLQDHLQPNTASDLLYKNSLSDNARTIYAGLIRVEPQAQQTDAYQKVRNLLLSDEAEANSMPGLEILADQVKCSHGATSGQIDEEELFYMLSRGLPATTAKELIVAGFLNETLKRLPNEAIAGHLRERIQEKFDRLHARA